MSITLSLAQLHAKAGVSTSPAFVKDRICHNGAKEDSQGSRLCNCLAEVNNFPTTAGLASSAAGYACLMAALCKRNGMDGEVSDITKRGSGSACRSVYGELVLWHTKDIQSFVEGTRMFYRMV